ncbi:hypothetical protein OAO87_01550 [bacterium]|nr:hypothetical protein [bacterium]
MFIDKLIRSAPASSSLEVFAESTSSIQKQQSDELHAVVTVAASRLAMPERAASVVEALMAMDIRFVWQISQLDSEDWAKTGCSAGLKAAIKTEVARVPAATTVPAAQTEPMPAVASGSQQDALPDRLRRFLLMPEPDGQPARRLDEQDCLLSRTAHG